MQRYPPPSPSYVRTGTYGRSWRRKVTATEAQLVNRTPYAVYVGGPWPQGGRRKGERQTRVMHAKGWVSISVAAKKAAKEHRNLINKAIKGRVVPR